MLSVVICVGPVICVLDKEISEASSGVDSLKDEEMGVVGSELAEPIGISVVEMAVSEAMDSTENEEAYVIVDEIVSLEGTESTETVAVLNISGVKDETDNVAIDSTIIVAIVDEKVSAVSEEPVSADNEELDVDCSDASELVVSLLGL